MILSRPRLLLECMWMIFSRLRLLSVAMYGVHVDDFLPPPSPVRVELNKIKEKGFLVPTRTRIKTSDDLRPQGEVPPTPPVEQCAEPTILVPSSISPVPPTLPVAKIGMAVAALTPRKRKCLIDKRTVFEADLNTFHVIDAEATESINRRSTWRYSRARRKTRG